MNLVLAVIGVIASPFLLMLTIGFIVDKAEEADDARNYKANCKNLPQMSFEEFEKFYWISPDKWTLDFDCVKYETYNNNGYTSSDIYFKTWKDVKKYIKFRTELANNKTKERSNKSMNLILKDIQKDVNAKLEQGMRMIERGAQN